MKLTQHMAFMLTLLIAGACSMQVNTEKDTVPYVKNAITDRSSRAHLVLMGLGKQSPMNNISIIGPAQTCDKLAAQFMSSDIHDNVDAGIHADGLPDFAGETIISIVDTSASYYSEFMAEGMETELRESAAMRAILALDTLCHVSRYDIDGMGSKSSAKIIVLSDPFLEEYGKFDIDTMFRSTSCTVPVVSPIKSMLDMAVKESGRTMNVAVICTTEYKDSEIYATIFNRLAKEYGIAEIQCRCLAPTDSAAHLTSILREYVENGGVKPFDIIYIDNPSVRPEAIKAELEHIRDINYEDSMVYGRLLTQNIKVYEAGACMIEACYWLLRADNMFSHKIAYPDAVSFQTAQHPVNQDELILIPVSNVQN